MAFSSIVSALSPDHRALAFRFARPEAPDDLAKWTPDALLESLCLGLEIPFLNLKPEHVEFETYRIFHSFFLSWKCVPMFRSDILLTVACAQPWSDALLRQFRKVLHLEIHVVGATEIDLDRTIASLEARCKATPPRIEAPTFPMPRGPLHGWTLVGDNFIDMAVLIVRQAHALGTSDIHLEPQDDKLDVRFRIHGVPEVMPPIPKDIMGGLLGAIKALSNISDTAGGQAMSGRAKVEVGPDYWLDLRVECQPGVSGKDFIVLRLLDPMSIRKHLGTLPFSGSDLEIVERNLSQENGIIFITGPTGSGKTTTLYRMLTSIDLSDNVVRTIEDPVEYVIPRIAQIPAPIDPETGRPSFALALRSHLRADPEVIMVGEIRDRETAGTAVQASLTGHLILTTVHTNDAPGVIQRLIELGVEPFYIQSTLRLVISQRLVRKMCPKCRIKDPSPETVKKHFSRMGLVAPEHVHTPGGCGACNHTGIIGRMPIFEVMEVSDDMKELIMKNRPMKDIVAVWRSEGGVSLVERGLELLANGDTAFEDVESLCLPTGLDLRSGGKLE